MTNNRQQRPPSSRQERAAWYTTALEDQASSGLSMAEYAAEVGVAAATLYQWKRRLSGRAESPSGSNTARPSGLIQVGLNDSVAVEAQSMFIVRLSPERSIEVPQDFETEALEQLLSILEAC
ncbi:MAG: hypothetical protein DRR04_14225 [Gammaproteobacteria bacterium]|nr:MAG: hypothetical protein DRR04_14225 [Gammaproteobacteria bacterium]